MDEGAVEPAGPRGLSGPWAVAARGDVALDDHGRCWRCRGEHRAGSCGPRGRADRGQRRGEGRGVRRGRGRWLRGATGRWTTTGGAGGAAGSIGGASRGPEGGRTAGNGAAKVAVPRGESGTQTVTAWWCWRCRGRRRGARGRGLGGFAGDGRWRGSCCRNGWGKLLLRQVCFYQSLFATHGRSPSKHSWGLIRPCDLVFTLVTRHGTPQPAPDFFLALGSILRCPAHEMPIRGSLRHLFFRPNKVSCLIVVLSVLAALTHRRPSSAYPSAEEKMAWSYQGGQRWRSSAAAAVKGMSSRVLLHVRL